MPARYEAIRLAIERRGDTREGSLSIWVTFEMADAFTAVFLRDPDSPAVREGLELMAEFCRRIAPDALAQGDLVQVEVRHALFGAAVAQPAGWHATSRCPSPFLRCPRAARTPSRPSTASIGSSTPPASVSGWRRRMVAAHRAPRRSDLRGGRRAPTARAGPSVHPGGPLSITIRPAVADDAPAIAEIWNRPGATPISATCPTRSSRCGPLSRSANAPPHWSPRHPSPWSTGSSPASCRMPMTS